VRVLAIAFAVLSMSFVPATNAGAQLGPQVPAPLTQDNAPPPPEAPTPKDEGGMSTRQKILIFGSAAVILALIGWLIVRDAHKAAPAEEHAPRTPDEKRMSTRERERHQRQKRTKAKAAKRQRKKNRPR
jgi:hypothetical protein